MFRSYINVSLIVMSVVVFGCSSGSDGQNDNNQSNTTTVFTQTIVPVATPGVGNSVYDNIVRNTNLSMLRTAIDVADLADTLDDEASDFTVFAPDNAAFQALENANPDDEIITALLANPEGLAVILAYHVLPGTTDAAAVGADLPTEIVTLNGDTVFLGSSNSSPSGLAIGGAEITIPDSNYLPGTSIGVVHIINRVLLTD